MVQFRRRFLQERLEGVNEIRREKEIGKILISDDKILFPRTHGFDAFLLLRAKAFLLIEKG